MTHAPSTPRRHLRWYRHLGVFAILLASVGTLTLGLASAETVETRATISREAYFTYPITQTSPPVIRNGFPPATACLVAGLVGVPQVCGTEAQQVASLLGLTDGLPIPITPDGDLAQPNALPGTTPVGMFGGQPRYVSLEAFSLPALQDGQRYGKFELVMYQNGFNFAIESPATRNLVLQIVSQLSGRDPAKVAAAVTDALTGKIPLTTETITGIEACPIISEWNAGRGQGASLDGSRVPRVDCVTGTSGKFNAADGSWTFDITFAVQAWTEADAAGGVLANQGIMLRPVGAPNLAYGDPDFSVNWVVSLGDSTNADPNLRPRFRYETVLDENAEVVDPVGDLDFSNTSDDSADVLGGGFASDDFGAGAVADNGAGGVVTDNDGGSTSDSTGGGSARTISSSKGTTPGWVWFILPLALLAAYVFDQSLSATPAALRRRPGALTRLGHRVAAAGPPEGDQ